MGIKLYTLKMNEEGRPQLRVDKNLRYNYGVDWSDMLSIECLNDLFDIRKDYVESMYVMGYDDEGDLLGIYLASKGNRTETMVPLAPIFTALLLMGASSFSITHNHPGPDSPTVCNPSEADKQMTQAVKQIADLLGIRFIDSRIVSECKYFSFRNAGLLIG